MWITFLIPIVVGFLLLVLAALSFRAARSASLTAQKETIVSVADFAAQVVNLHWIAPRERSVRVLSGSETFRRRLQGDAGFDELLAEWKRAYDLHEGYFFIYYGLEEGGIELYPDLPLPEGFDHRTRPWYQAGITSEGDPVWSPPYDEIITGEPTLSTTMPIVDDSGNNIGVFGIDLTFASLRESLAAIPLPAEAVVYLADEEGTPLVGSDGSYRTLQRLPESSDELLVYHPHTLQNGWQMAVAVPRDSLIRAFSGAVAPFLAMSVAVYLVLFGSLALTVLRLASRTRRLTAYLSDVMEGNDVLRSIFRTHDEFHVLNRRFNDVLHAARNAEADRLAQERVYRELIEQTSIGFFKLNRSGKPAYINDVCAEMLGYDREELLAFTSVFEMFPTPADRRSFLRPLLRDGEVRNHRVRLLQKSGQPIWVAITAVINDTASRKIEFEIDGFMVDATEHVVEQKRLEEVANTDPLTGLANRRALKTAYRKNRESVSPCSLVFFDIDKFKEVNDLHGHDVGDRILRHIAEVVTSVLRGDDVFARYGGDEFAVLLPGTNGENAIALAERLRGAIRTAPPPEDVPLVPSLSIGVVERADSGWSLEEMIIQADRALYSSKTLGGDTVTVAKVGEEATVGS